MKHVYSLLIIMLTAITAVSQIIPSSQYPTVELKGTQHIKFKSAINKRDYTVDIQLPASYKDSSSKTYPVFYLLDGQWNFPFISIMAGGLLYDNLMPEVIL